MKCPCNPANSYESCCAIAHENVSKVHTAVQLMRSRYSAFVMANGDYLNISHHKSTRSSKAVCQEIAQWASQVTWVKLDIIDTTNGKKKDNFGTVYFKAFYLENGKMEVIEENSRFKKEANIWYYLDGN